jgi:hypothetical protein
MLKTLEMPRVTLNDFEKVTSGDIRYALEKFKSCFYIFSKTVKDRAMEFSGMTDLLIGVCNRGLSMSTVTSGRHRK